MPATTNYFKLDAITSTCPVDATKKGTNVASWQTQSKLCSTAVTPTTCQDLKCMASVGNCVAYGGDYPTCPSMFPFRSLWYTGYTDTRTCTSCHADGGPDPRTRAMFAGLDMNGVALNSASLTWDFIKRLKGVTKMKVLIKGLETREDAALAVKHGADGIIVSNHGGRATETGRGTLECLPEVVKAAGGKIPVLVDGGVHEKGGDGGRRSVDGHGYGGSRIAQVKA